jgi:hypothetical protein
LLQVTFCFLVWEGFDCASDGVCFDAKTFVAAANAKVSPAAAAIFVAVRLCILSIGLLKLKIRLSKAQVSAAIATACVVSQCVHEALVKAATGMCAARFESSVARCDTLFGANLRQLAVVQARVHTEARTPGGGPPSRRERLHPRRQR